jgi:hypothetical protein
MEEHASFYTYLLGAGFINSCPWSLGVLFNKEVVCNPYEWIMPELTTHPTRERVA